MSMYDFVIVGGGSVGLVVAAHLSEDSGKRVLVLVLESTSGGIETVKTLLDQYRPSAGDSPDHARTTQPLSRGSVHIQSGDLSVAPAINPRYLSHPVDVEIMARHIVHVKTIAESSPLNKLLHEPLAHRDPASEFDHVESAKEYGRASVVSTWHLVGTCAMLPREKGGVVDAKLDVYGVENLRVVVASAISLVSTANLQATVYAFAEREADIIRRGGI